MPRQPEEREYAAEGLSSLAHAIRRSTAMYVAMQVTPPDSTLEDMFENFDRIAEKIGGKAVQREQEMSEEEPQKRPSLGIPFDQRDAD